jgi:hypothetical protein
VRAVPQAHLIAGAAALLAAVLVVALASSGGGTPRAVRHAARPALIGGVPLQRARCAQWRAGGPAQRLAVVRALAQTVGGPSGTARGTTLSTADALNVFDEACSSRVARHFLLYEIYIRVAGFSSLRRPAE